MKNTINEEVKVYTLPEKTVKAYNAEAEAYAKAAKREEVVTGYAVSKDYVAFVKPEAGFVPDKWGMVKSCKYVAYIGKDEDIIKPDMPTETREADVLITLWDMPEAKRNAKKITETLNNMREAIADKHFQSAEDISTYVVDGVKKVYGYADFGKINIGVNETPETVADKWNDADIADFIAACFTKTGTYADSAVSAGQMRKFLQARFAKIVNCYPDMNAVKAKREAKAAKRRAKTEAKRAEKAEAEAKAAEAAEAKKREAEAAKAAKAAEAAEATHKDAEDIANAKRKAAKREAAKREAK